MSYKNDFPDFDLRLGEVLIVLSDIAAGDYESRCSAELPLAHPLGAVFAGVNQMIDSLQAESARRAAYELELKDKLETIQNQKVVIRGLSTPIIEVGDNVLCLTVIGLFDDARSAFVMTDLLEAVVEKSARCVIIDITGAEIADAANAQIFLRMVKGIRLLGADCMLTGMSSSLAAKLIEMDIDLENVSCYSTLRAALKELSHRTAQAKRP